MAINLLICVNVLFILYTAVSYAQQSDAPTVTLPDGPIKGHVLKTARNNSYYAFQQIPYASPPVGYLRFKDPAAAQKWDKVLNVTKNSLICFQGRRRDIPEDLKESEDCLYINVYTPVEPGSDSTPASVMVWIHGGDFHYGDGTFQSYNPEFFIDYGVVVVTLNYRLGAFGFLTTTDGVIPGNLGLKDQNLALQWVKNNINLFGGNPSSITIAGENSGGIAVGYHLVSQKSKGLFQGAIMQSGTVLCANGYQANAEYFAFEMGRVLDNFDSDKSKDLLKLLQNVTATDINNAVIDIPSNMEVGLGTRKLIWLPIIENVMFSDALITGPMHESIKSGKAVRVPILLGYNSEEEIRLMEDESTLSELAQEMDGNFSQIIRNKFNMSEGSKYIAGRGMRQIYTMDLFQKNFELFVKFMSDEAYTTPIIRHADLQAKFSKVYLYQFSHKGLLGGLNLTVTGSDTVGNGEELNYMWRNNKYSSDKLPVSDKVTQHRLLMMWTNFIKYQNPIPEGQDNGLLSDILWPAVTSTNISYLNINRTLEVKTDPRMYQNIVQVIDRYAVTPLVTF